MGSIQEIHLPCQRFLSSIPNYFFDKYNQFPIIWQKNLNQSESFHYHALFISNPILQWQRGSSWEKMSLHYSFSTPNQFKPWQYKIHLLNSRFRQKIINVKQLFQKILVSHLIENQQLVLTWEYGLHCVCVFTFRDNHWVVTSNLESTK